MTNPLHDLRAGAGRSARLVDWVSERLEAVSRRRFLVGVAVTGSALATDPVAYALRPQTAYATICGPGNTASSGWTVFCATLNKGANVCPPGSFAAGWWKAAGSSWCGGSYRYIVDCNATCSRCTSGCSDHICDSKCWSCSCSTGSSATCDQRLVCCNAFRYGQCNTHVKCSGGVHCRVASCVPPYTWASCSTTSFTSNTTANHSTPYLPQWGPIMSKYVRMGDMRSYLKGSLGPIETVGDGRGTLVRFEGGTIYDTSTTAATPLTAWVDSVYQANGGPTGPLGYPVRDRVGDLRDGGWLQQFANGCITDSPATTTQVVYGYRWKIWQDNGREGGVLGYPVAAMEALPDGWLQAFQNGCIVDSNATTTQVVHGYRWKVWQDNGRESGVLGYPVAPMEAVPDGWLQTFQNGCIVDSNATTTQLVLGPVFQAWVSAGRTTGLLGFPVSGQTTDGRGQGQVFQRGQVWGLSGGPAYAVSGAILSAWVAAGGAAGTYGYPTAPVIANIDGTSSQTFEGGVVTV